MPGGVGTLGDPSGPPLPPLPAPQLLTTPQRPCPAQWGNEASRNTRSRFFILSKDWDRLRSQGQALLAQGTPSGDPPPSSGPGLAGSGHVHRV